MHAAVPCGTRDSPVRNSGPVQQTEQLLNHRIKPEDVGKQVPFFGAIEYSYLDWAKEGLALAHQLGLESWTKCLHQVMNTLLDAIKDSIKGQDTKWTRFMQAVKAIKI